MRYRLRKSRKGDEPELKNIWRICFGDSDEYINVFFEKIYIPGSAAVAETEEGHICSAMYTLEAGVSGGEKCGYLYALGTLPEYRGRGIGEAVTRKAAELGFDRGFDLCVTCPASKTLFDYYRGMGFEDFSRISVLEWNGDAIAENNAPGIMSISLDNYMLFREKMLRDDYVKFGRDYMEFLQSSLEYAGGGFFLIEGDCITVAEPDGDTGVRVRELLTENKPPQKFMRLLAQHFCSSRVIAYVPEIQGTGNPHTLVMRKCGKMRDTSKLYNYFPFVFD